LFRKVKCAISINCKSNFTFTTSTYGASKAEQLADKINKFFDNIEYFDRSEN
jgi:hypothetical protein